MTEPEPIALFAYGSLVSPQSAAQTLGRSIAPGSRQGESPLATLTGWRRRFSQVRDNRTCEKTFARDCDGSIPTHVLALNVERTGDPLDRVNGVLIALSRRELERLDARELRYDRVEVGAEITQPSALARFGRVYAYTAKAAHLAREPLAEAVILRAYAVEVERAFAQLGAAQLEAYRDSTGPYPAELVDAHLVRDRIPIGNPRRW